MEAKDLLKHIKVSLDVKGISDLLYGAADDKLKALVEDSENSLDDVLYNVLAPALKVELDKQAVELQAKLDEKIAEVWGEALA